MSELSLEEHEAMCTLLTRSASTPVKSNSQSGHDIEQGTTLVFDSPHSSKPFDDKLKSRVQIVIKPKDEIESQLTQGKPVLTYTFA